MAGPAAQVDAVFNFAYAQARDKTNLVASRFSALQGLLNQPVDLMQRNWRGQLSGLNSALPPPLDATPFTDREFGAEYESTQRRVAVELEAIFTDYFTNWFPLDDSYAQAKDWVQRALTTGGTGINAAVEAQLWNRDRSRILEDSARAADEAIASWAAKRFPIPPGAATYQLLQLSRDAQKAIAEVSRTTAIKAFETEIENIRLAIGRAIELQQAVIDNAEKFFRLQMFPERFAQETESARFDIRNKFLTAAEDLYKLQLNSFEQYQHRNLTLGLDDERRMIETNLATKLNVLDKKVGAAIEEAKSLATQASAALNALHAQASISGSESTIINE